MVIFYIIVFLVLVLPPVFLVKLAKDKGAGKPVHPVLEAVLWGIWLMSVFTIVRYLWDTRG